MDLKTQLEEIAAELKKPGKDVNKLTLSAKLLTAVAQLQESKDEIPADVLAPFDSESRRLAVCCFLTITMASMNDQHEP